jgi:tetraacyldisaccharide 4'-kinase
MKETVNIVSDEKQIFLSACEAGDEPRMLADNLPGVPVLTGVDRTVTGNYAVETMAAGLLIMDDGFQHMALCRDLDLVLFSASALVGNGWVCPGGPLREPMHALGRADAFVVTGVNRENRARVEAFVRDLPSDFSEKPLFCGTYTPAGIQKIGVQESDSYLEEDAVSLFAFCGIATPESFLNSLAEEKLNVQGSMAFGDHHDFSEDDLRSVEQEAVAAGCEALITTAKDYVKLKKFSMKMPVWVLNVKLEMEPSFDKFILDKM